MKKVKYLLIAIITLVVPLVVLAKTNIEGTDIIDIKVSENWKLYNKDNLEEMMTELNFDAARKSEYKYAWMTNSYYFDIIRESKDAEILLIKKVSDSEMDDLSIYQDDKIEATFTEVQKKYEGFKPKVYLYTTNKGIKYYKIQYTDETLGVNIIDYITNIHGNMYQYKIQSNIEISNDVEKEIESIINSIEYDKYIKFVEKNAITDEPKKSNAPIIIVIVLFVLIIGGCIGAYIYINKKKNNSKKTVVTQVYNPVQNNTINPATAEFMNTTQQTTIQSQNNDKQDQQKEENNNNKGQ